MIYKCFISIRKLQNFYKITLVWIPALRDPFGNDYTVELVTDSSIGVNLSKREQQFFIISLKILSHRLGKMGNVMEM